MASVGIFYQAEGLKEIEFLEMEPERSFAELKALLIERHGFETDVFIFLEDGQEPLDEALLLREHIGRVGIKAHVHRCRHIEVSVSFNGQVVQHRFPPSATVAKVKRWAAEHEFHMTEQEAGEHVLQIRGTHERPSPGTHIGTLTSCPACKLEFDLVPDQRVNGASIREVA